MADRPAGMGRGLAAILSVAPREDGEELRQIPPELITPNPHQPRRVFDDEALAALADSIRQRGVLQPVLVRPLLGGRFELVAGERRWRAARLADLELIPAVVRPHDDAASLEVALIENMAREDLNPVDAARACAALVDELGLTREEVGLRVGRSRVAVSNLIRVLELPDEVLERLERGELSEGHGRALLLADHVRRRELARAAAAGGWSVRELEARARASQGKPTGPGSGSRRPRRAGQLADLPADQQAALDQIADSLGTALGCEVTVRPAGRGCAAELRFADLDEARAVVRRFGAPSTG